MIKRAFLCNPPTGLYVREDRCQSSVDDFAIDFSRPPMDLLMAAAYLEQGGVKVMVRDYPIEGGIWDDFYKDLNDFMPDLLLISTTTPTLKEDIHACVIAKQIHPEIITCAKGAHFSTEDIGVLSTFTCLDILFNSEDLSSIDRIAAGIPLRDICGITFRDNGFPKRNPRCEVIKNLDDMPMPALHLLNNNLYIRPDTGRPTAHIETSRGCPAKCIYCLVQIVSGKSIRTKSPSRVVDEIDRCIHKFDIHDFHFKSDTFTWNKPWVLELCKEIKRRNLKIEWFCNSRVDTIDEERIAPMKETGCFAIGFGIESGNQEILDRIGKGITLDQSRKAINLCKKYGIQSYAYFIIGFPWDTHKTVQQTIDFAMELDSDFMDIFIVYPFPGTTLEKIVQDNQLFVEKPKGRAYSQSIVRTYTLSPEELQKYRRITLTRFYTRPRYIIRKLYKARNPIIIGNYIKRGVQLLSTLFKEGHGEIK